MWIINEVLPYLEVEGLTMRGIEARELPSLIFGILICQAAGIAGSIFTGLSVSTWYPTLANQMGKNGG